MNGPHPQQEYAGPLFVRVFIRRPGIYLIKNIQNQKVYVGSSKNLSDRQKTHIGPLKLNKHKNPHLQSAINFYGHDSFLWVIQEFCEESELKAREQFWMDELNATNREFGYNITLHALRREGCIAEETRQKMRENWHKTHPPPTLETRYLLSKSSKGRKKTPEEIKKSADARRGKTWKKNGPSEKSRLHGVRLGDMTRPESLLRSQRLSLALRGKKHSTNHIRSRRESRLANYYTWQSPSGEIFDIRYVKEFCERNNLSVASAYLVIRSGDKKTTLKGWKFISKTPVSSSP